MLVTTQDTPTVPEYRCPEFAISPLLRQDFNVDAAQNNTQKSKMNITPIAATNVASRSSWTHRVASNIYRALTTLSTVILISACGGSGSSAPPPTGGITVTPGNESATITWASEPGVKYWIFYAPLSGKWTSVTTDNWINIKKGKAVIDATSPYVVANLDNGLTYSFTVNGRRGDGPGGPGSPSVSAVPRAPGATWQSLVGLGSNSSRGITYGTNSSDLKAYYLAVGDAGSAYHSKDGVTWSGIDALIGMNLAAATYSSSGFVVAGPGGLIRYSANLIVWTPAASGTSQNLNAIASNGPLAIAVGDNGTMLKSSNGVTWSPVTLPTTNHLYGITSSAAGLWTAVGGGGTVLTSSDGANWSMGASGTTANLRAVSIRSLTDGKHLIVATGDSGTIVTSKDSAKTWDAQVSGTTANLLAVHATTNQIFATGSGGTIVSSGDGKLWTNQNSGTTADLYAVIGGLSQCLAVGKGGTALLAR